MTSRHEFSREGGHQPEWLDPDGESRIGWRRHDILVSANQGPRLSWPERELTPQLGVNLYDDQPEGSE
jgi:hypothetical protein